MNYARQLIDAALAKQPDFPNALVELARIAGTEHKPDEAARLTERAIISGPNNAAAWLR